MIYFAIKENTVLSQMSEDKDFLIESLNANGFTDYEILETDLDIENNADNKYIFDFNEKEWIINPYYEQEQAEKRKEEFENAFFHTSLGWIRRSVSMKDGSTKSFLTDLLPQLVVGIPVLAYALPDFTQEVEIVDYQQKVVVTEQFIQECKNQLYADFYGTNPE